MRTFLRPIEFHVEAALASADPYHVMPKDVVAVVPVVEVIHLLDPAKTLRDLGR